VATRKPWELLSANYRHRLERAGITKEKHAAGHSIKAAAGHGAHTPSEIAKRLRRPFTKGPALFRRADSLGITNVQITAAITLGGEEKASLALDYVQSRTDAFVASGKTVKGKDLPTFEQFVIETMGQDYWDEYDWEDFLELDWLNYYHD
jgi:hypothetical protein